METRLTKDDLLGALGGWNRFLRRKIHLIACGGTAMTFLGVKPSTRDVDFMVPEEGEYDYLIRLLRSLGYESVSGPGWARRDERYQFDLFRGNRIHTTELLESPLVEGRHQFFHEFSRIYIGILNYYDLISSKLMRGTPVDFDDCAMLYSSRSSDIDLPRLHDHFLELISYDISEDRLRPNIGIFMERIKEGNVDG
ncbi:MAG: hypothetical protein ACNA8S_09965 [Deferrisomatales bacterium]